MSEKLPCIIVDIDGTVADCSHRLHHVTGGHRNWPKFFAKMDKDTPIWPVIKLVSHYSSSNPDGYTIFVSGRPEEYRATTEFWLLKYFPSWDYELRMRPSGDYRPDHIVKREILEAIRADGYDPQLVIDDRQSVVDMWRSEGLICLQVNTKEDFEPRLNGKEVLWILIGPSGIGKSSWAEQRSDPDKIVSSDDLRYQMFGSSRDQTHNDEVFAAFHDLIRIRTKHGLFTIADATHLRTKDRVAAAKLAPANTKVRYVVFNNRTIEEVKKTAGWRNEVPSLIDKHFQRMKSQLPEIRRGDGLPNVIVEELT